MLNYYIMERLIEFQQREIEQKARHAWKWLESDHSRQTTKNSSAHVTVQPAAVCCCC